MVMYDWESEFKTKENRISTKEKIAPQHLFTAFLSNFKGRRNSIQSTTVFYYEDEEIISWLPSVKQSILKRMKRNISGILSSLTFK